MQNRKVKKVSEITKIQNKGSNLEWFVLTSYRCINTFILCALPYMMLLLGQYLYKVRGIYACGGEVFLPAVAILLVYKLNCVGRKIERKLIKLPIPKRRLTNVKRTGETTINPDDIPLAVLYLARLEDYLKIKGYTDK